MALAPGFITAGLLSSMLNNLMRLSHGFDVGKDSCARCWTSKMLITVQQWKVFNFFDVTEVRLPDDDRESLSAFDVSRPSGHSLL